MILSKDDGTFLGVAPGVGVTTDDGRIIMPLYSTKKAPPLYSLDNGETWHRMTRCPYSENLDEWQMITTPNGEVLGLGRQSHTEKRLFQYLQTAQSHGKSAVKQLFMHRNAKRALLRRTVMFSAHTPAKDKKRRRYINRKTAYGKGRYTHIDWFKDVEINKGFLHTPALRRLTMTLSACSMNLSPAVILNSRLSK